MLLVVDVNVIYSALMKRGNSLIVFEANKISNKFEFISPEFVTFELDNKIGKILSKSKLTLDELNEALLLIKEQITFIPSSDFLDKLPEAIELNLKDSPYLALALEFDCPIFSGDKGLKEQSKVKVLPQKELLDMLGIE